MTQQEKDLPPEEPKISYGKKFSQTEEMYTVRQMNRELEELAREDGMLDEDAPAEKQAARTEPNEAPARKSKPQHATGRQAKIDPTAMRGAPIGALPASPEPPPRARFTEVVDDAQRYIGMIRGGVRDITMAAFRLARLPVEVAVLAAQRLRPLRA